MKNKKVLYFLVPAVIAIWSAIAYRVYMGVGHEATLPQAMHAGAGKKAQVDDALQDYALLLNYSDPFLSYGRAEAPVVETKSPATSTPAAVVAKPAEQPPLPAGPAFPLIVYLGKIENAERKAAVALVRINNQSFMLKEGDTGLEVSLKKVWRDSILIEYSKVKKVVKR